MAKHSAIKGVSSITTVLGAKTSFNGTLKFDSSLMICGKFDGNIDAKGTLYIDEDAVVNVSKMKAMSVIVAGNINGDIEAADKVEFMPTAHVRGNVKTTRLRISDGVLFEGKCEMIKQNEILDPFANKSNENAQ